MKTPTTFVFHGHAANSSGRRLGHSAVPKSSFLFSLRLSVSLSLFPSFSSPILSIQITRARITHTHLYTHTHSLTQTDRYTHTGRKIYRDRDRTCKFQALYIDDLYIAPNCEGRISWARVRERASISLCVYEFGVYEFLSYIFRIYKSRVCS